MARSIQALDQARIEAGLSQIQLTSAANLNPSSYRRYLSGERRPKPTTLKRIDYALQKLKRPKDPEAKGKAYLVYRLCVAILCLKGGLSPARVLSHKPSDRRTADKEWAQAAVIRRQAQYLANTACLISQADLARAVGVTRAAVCLGLGDMEDSRDNPEVEQLFLVIEEAILS